jgi:hypothetical protein
MKKILTFIGLGLLLLICFLAYFFSVAWANKEAIKTNEPPVNYLVAVKDEVHDELFEEETEQSKKIVERLFKHMEYRVISSNVKGEMATVKLEITNINGGEAWQDALEQYAIMCFDNAFAEDYMGTEGLEAEYLKSLERAFKSANYITTKVDVHMEFIGSRWVVDVNEDLVNAITGNLLYAKYGRISYDANGKIEDDSLSNDDILDHLDKMDDLQNFQKEDSDEEVPKEEPDFNEPAPEPEIPETPTEIIIMDNEYVIISIVDAFYDPNNSQYVLSFKTVSKFDKDLFLYTEDVAANGEMKTNQWCATVYTGQECISNLRLDNIEDLQSLILKIVISDDNNYSDYMSEKITLTFK